MKKPTIHQKKVVASSRLFAIETVDLEFSNGEKRQYERLARSGQGAVLIVPLLDNETMLLIREYAVGTERYELGFPKGKVEVGEDKLHAANREIMEEVGYEANTLTIMKELSLAPGYMGHMTAIVLAQDLTPNRVSGDEPEALEVIEWKVDDIDALIMHDKFCEGRSVAALLYLQHF
ncbi:MAG: ADP compounds hydrolase NudE, partial [Cocleimonas sp.]|nr:ADP compounds hydrolase NudE [Cocleimonas sp.]